MCGVCPFNFRLCTVLYCTKKNATRTLRGSSSWVVDKSYRALNEEAAGLGTRAGIPVRDRSTPSLCRTPPSCRLSPAVAPAAPHTSCSRLCSWTWRGISRTDPVRRAAHVCTGKRRGSRALGRTVSRSSPCSCRAVKAESLIEGGSGRSTTEVSTSSHVGPKNFSLHTHACATQTPLPPHGRPIASVGQSRSCSQRSPP